LDKIPENLSEIPENPGKNGAQRCVTSKTDAQRFSKKQMKTFFLEVAQKKVFVIFVGENLLAKVVQQLSGKFGEIRAKILRTSKNFLGPTPMFCTIPNIVECLSRCCNSLKHCLALGKDGLYNHLLFGDLKHS